MKKEQGKIIFQVLQYVQAVCNVSMLMDLVKKF